MFCIWASALIGSCLPMTIILVLKDKPRMKLTIFYVCQFKSVHIPLSYTYILCFNKSKKAKIIVWLTWPHVSILLVKMFLQHLDVLVSDRMVRHFWLVSHNNVIHASYTLITSQQEDKIFFRQNFVWGMGRDITKKFRIKRNWSNFF